MTHDEWAQHVEEALEKIYKNLEFIEDEADTDHIEQEALTAMGHIEDIPYHEDIDE